MKINILFDLSNNPAGGGNQFLKALKSHFIHKDLYTETVQDADVVLFNSHQCFKEVVAAKIRYPHKTFIHRIDGPVQLYNNSADKRDYKAYALSRLVADATIFQSEWSRENNYKCGMKKKPSSIVIYNAADDKIFNKGNKTKFNKDRKTKIVITSWSKNLNKGFNTYQWLDNNLDFEKYEVTFIGNTFIKFKNIQHIESVPSRNLAVLLKHHDIYLTASINDPCSNSLIEALQCGLRAVALNSGGHTELIQKYDGKLFAEVDQIECALKAVIAEYDSFEVEMPKFEEIGDQYYEFIRSNYERKNNAT